ncbi:TPA: class I SAM-dependent methyltransferase [bacterium]|nr:class I SAM-dependent methyltransferase [bacterium]
MNKRRVSKKVNKHKKTHWGSVASWYDDYIGQEGSEFHQTIIMPGIVKMLRSTYKSVEGLNIIDFACGQGVLCRYLSKRGARCTGIDLAKELIDKAKERSNETNIDYLVGDVTSLLNEDGSLKFGLKENSFDAITIVLAIQNISPLTPVWKAAYSLLKKGGSLIIVMMHPCFRIPQSSDWNFNNDLHRQERVLWRYLVSHEVSIDAHPGKKASGKKSASTIHFHRPLQSYINTLGNARLYIEHIDEWVSNKKEQEGVKSEELMRAKSEIPMFLAIQARKLD